MNTKLKKIALACTGGGIKACVNIGVLRALNELNIEVEAISGASLGALISLLYLCDYTPEEILKICENDVVKFSNFNFFNIICAIPNLFINGGLKNPKEMVKYIKKFENENNIKTFKDIKKPLIVPSLDISNREIAYYSSKPLNGPYKYYCDRTISEAIRSSCAVPLFFTPNKVTMNNKNHFMLDGGILTNTLINPLRQFSDYVIGVTNKFYPKERSRVNLFTGFTQTFQSMRREFLAKERQSADLWIQMDTKTNKFIGSKDKLKYFEELRLRNNYEIC